MKKLYILIFLLLFSSLTAADSEHSVSFTKADFTISADLQSIVCAKINSNLNIGSLSLPGQTMYIPLDNPDNTAFTYSVSEKELLGQFDADILADVTTSIQSSSRDSMLSSPLSEKLGTIPVVNHGIIKSGELIFLKLQLFPVTYSSEHELLFNREIDLYLNQTLIEPSKLISVQQLRNISKTNKMNLGRTASSSSEVYLIVTNADLYESFTQLADYKNSVGISTRIELIEDILPLYTGRDDAEKLREYLKDFYADGGQYLLLGGDETILPIRYTYHNIAMTDISLENQQVCDLYFADLTGDWNFDNDNVWGEKYTDSADLSPELFVGRLPFNSSVEVANYVDKLIDYETNRNQIDLSYLTHSFFFSSDQMRDYENVGQHNLIAQAFPAYFINDTTSGVEYSRGDDPAPTNKTPDELISDLSDGYGIINIIAHGSSSTFAVRTASYNDWPKAYFTTDSNSTGHGTISKLEANGKVSFYASLGCDNAAFDKDQPPFNQVSPNMAQTLLAMPNSGAIGLIGNTRWGWVSSSHLLQKRLFEYMFANPDRPVVEAMHLMKDDYYYYRDLIFSINYFGDPTLVVHTDIPKEIDMTIGFQQNNLLVSTESEGIPLEETEIIISQDAVVIGEYRTDENGMVEIDNMFAYGVTYTIAAVKNGQLINLKDFTPSIATGIDDNNTSLPTEFSLSQNYPNPFNPSTTITFALPTGSEIKIAVYNVLGQEVAVLADNYFPAGIHELEWTSRSTDGSEVTSGIYFYRIETEAYSTTKKMLLLR